MSIVSSRSTFLKSEFMKRWREYMEKLINVENEWDGQVEYDVIEWLREHITETAVEKAIAKIRSGKAGGPTELVEEIIRVAGHVGGENDGNL